MLRTRTWGTGDPVVLIHGFTQSGAAWAPLAERLATEHRVVAVDLPGHGDSAGVDADLGESATLVVGAVDETIGGPGPAGEAGGRGARGGATTAAYVGYSLGGRVLLHLALAHPRAARRLVLVSATGGIDDPGGRAARRAADELLAEQVERDGVEAFVRWWLERPLFATLPAESAALDSRLGGTAAGLASSLRRAGAGTQQPLWDRLGALDMPVLVVAGALDRAYCERAERLVAAIGANARLAVIDGAGHACHLEAPQRWLEVVGPFLAEA